MRIQTRLIRFAVSVCLVTAFQGCATTSPEPEDTVPVGYKYSPTIPPGIESVEAAKNDLSELLSGPQCPGVRYYGEPGINDFARKDALTELVKGKSGPISFWYGHEGLVFMAFESLTVLDDGIKVCPRIAFPFDDLIACSIVVEKTEERPGAGHHIVGSHVGSFVRPYKVDFPGRMTFLFTDRSDAQRFADDLFFIQQTLKKAHDERRARLESRASEYRSMAVKPPVSEEQRKYIVQANAPSEAEVQAAKQKAIMLAAQQAAMKKAKEASAQAEHEKMMKSYKQLEGAQGAGFKTLSDSSLNFKTLDGDMEALSAGARKPFDAPSDVNVPGSAAIAVGTPFFGDTMPVETIQFLVQPENDPNVVDLRDAQTYVVENLKKDSNDLEAAVKRYEDKPDGEPIVHRPDCVALARKLNGLVQQRRQFQKTVDLAHEQLSTWETANRNALLNAAKDGLDWYTGHLLDKFVKRAEAAERLQRVYEKNAASMAQEGVNIVEIQAKIQRLKALSAAGRLSKLASNAGDWQTFIKDGASALMTQLTASNDEILGMLEDPQMQKYFEAEAPELKALLDISKIAASNKVFGKWVARKVPLIAGVELAINESYNALDWYLSYKQIREAHKINGRVLDAARQLQTNIDDTYLALRDCP